MNVTTQIPATQNTTWGFYGSMSEHADTAWSLGMTAVSDATGQLNIKGQVRPVVVPVQISQAQGLSTASGQFKLKRLDFKVGDGDWRDTSIVADEVEVRFKLALRNMPPL